MRSGRSESLLNSPTEAVRVQTRQMPQPMQKGYGKMEKKRLLRQNGNHSVEFQVGQFREGGVGACGEGERKKKTILSVLMFGKREKLSQLV